MQRVILLVQFMFITLFLFSQTEKQISDTVFLKSGEKIPVYKIIGVQKERLACYKYDYSKEYSCVDVAKVAYVKRKKVSEYDDNTVPILRDTVSATTKVKLEYNNLNKDKSEIDYKLGWVQYNLGEFYKQQRISQLFYGLSALTGIIGTTITITNSTATDYTKSIDNSKMANYFLFATTGLGALGLIIHIDSYKWMKRASISPTTNGVSVTLELN